MRTITADVKAIAIELGRAGAGNIIGVLAAMAQDVVARGKK
jgi:hypothetical protein